MNDTEILLEKLIEEALAPLNRGEPEAVADFEAWKIEQDKRDEEFEKDYEEYRKEQERHEGPGFSGFEIDEITRDLGENGDLWGDEDEEDLLMEITCERTLREHNEF